MTKRWIVLAVSFLSFLLLTPLAEAQIPTAAFGPETFTRGTAQPVSVVRTFSLQNLTGPFTLTVQNGEGKRGRISSATIGLNGVQVVGPNEFNKQVDRIQKTVNLEQQNTLTVQLRSEPGSSIIVTIEGFGPPPVSPIQGITINPDAIFVGEPGLVTVRARVPYDPADGIPTVTLQRVDTGGNVINSEGTLTDDGNLSNGDEISGDGVFSLRKSFLSQAEGRIHLRIARQQDSELVKSNVFFLDVFTHLTNSQLDTILSVENTALQNFNSLVGSLGRTGARDAVLAQIQQDPNVLQAGISENGNGIWMLFSSGVLGSLNLNPAGTQGGTSSVPAYFQYPFLPYVQPALPCQAAQANNNIKNRKAIVVAPFIFQFGATDMATPVRQILSNAACPTFDITYLENAAVTVDVMKTLNQYGVVVINTHGDSYYKGLLSLFFDKFGWGIPGSQVVFLTGQQATTANKAAYEVDLKKGRLAIDAGFYTILPSFISHYAANKYPDSIVMMGACRSAFNDTMANAFLNAGAKTYLGYTGYVFTTFNQQVASDFFHRFLEDPSITNTGQAFIPGQVQSDGAASFELRGSTTLQKPTSDLEDGSFELGNLGAWHSSGDGRVITQLGPFTPTEGSFMGVISTGLGFTVDSGSIEQKVCLPQNAQRLEFNWNFNSAEFVEFCGSIFQDFFKVEIITDSGTQTIFFRKVDDLCGSVTKTTLVFDQGDVWSTGWQSQSIDISGSAGKTVTIRFSAGDVGDSIFDTAILLDSIKIVAQQ